MLRSRVVSFGFLGFFLLANSSASAQAGANDPTFNPSDQGYVTGVGADNAVRCLVIQPDGKVIIAGEFTSYDGTTKDHIARLEQDGSLDAGFDIGSGASGAITALAILPDGKVLIGGFFSFSNGTSGIARLNADGTLDTSFNPGTGVDHAVYAITVQPDGKIIIGGWMETCNGVACGNFARLNADGSPDASFNTGTGANDVVNSTALQSDGKIIIGGDFTSYDGTLVDHIARLNADGSLDSNFNIGSGANASVRVTTVQADGKIIVGGLFTTFNGAAHHYITQLTSTGAVDVGFNPGTGTDNSVESITVQPDGKVIIGGYFTTFNGVARKSIARLSEHGILDTSFNPGSGPDGGVVATAVQTNGKIIAGGWFGSFTGVTRGGIVRLNEDGSLATSLGGANNVIRDIKLLPDGKILIGGDFTEFGGFSREHIARLNADGTVDLGFDPGVGTDGGVYSIVALPDGNMIIAGDFTTVNSISRPRIAELNMDGDLVTGFDPGNGMDSWVQTTAALSDGKIIIGGDFSTCNGIGRSRIARLNSDGSLDLSFDPGAGVAASGSMNPTVFSTTLQADGRIVVGGRFTSFDGSGRNYIARLNANGDLDTGFDPGTGADNTIRATLVQADGRILICGQFTNYNGNTRYHIARLNSDGSLDTSFDPGSGTNGHLYSMALQADGAIIIGGEFTSYDGVARNHIARLNADGSLDTNFDPGAGVNGLIYATTIQPDGKILIGGTFTDYDNIEHKRIERVLVGISTGIHETPAYDIRSLHVWPNPNDGSHLFLTLAGLDRSLRTVHAELFDATGRAILTTTLPVAGGSINTSLNLGHADTGIYLLKLIAGNRTFSQRVVVGH